MTSWLSAQTTNYVGRSLHLCNQEDLYEYIPSVPILRRWYAVLKYAMIYSPDVFPVAHIKKIRPFPKQYV